MVELEGPIKRWIGLSSDKKPGLGADNGNTVLASDIPPGSSILEADTGLVYRWTGKGWVAPPPDDRVLDLLRRILDEAYRERLVQEAALDLKSDDLIDQTTSPF